MENSGAASSNDSSGGVSGGGEQNQETLASNTNESGIENISDVKNKTESKKEINNNLKKFLLKVDGKEVEEEIDLSNEEQIKRHLQLSRVAQKRMQEASELKKQAIAEIQRRDQLLEMALSNPEDFFRKTGRDPYEIAEQLILKKFEQAQMSPEQKELLELREFKKQQDLFRQKQEEDHKKRIEEEQLTIEEQKYKSELDQGIGEALAKSGLPKTKFFVKQIALKIHNFAQRGKDLTADQAVELIKSDLNSDVKEFLGSLDAKAIQDYLGKDILDRLRKSDIELVNQKFQVPFKSQNQSPANAASSSSKLITEKQWRELQKKRSY